LTESSPENPSTEPATDKPKKPTPQRAKKGQQMYKPKSNEDASEPQPTPEQTSITIQNPTLETVDPPRNKKPKQKRAKKAPAQQQQNPSKFSQNGIEIHKKEIRAILLIETARKAKNWDALTKAVEYEYYGTKVSDLIGCELSEYVSSSSKQDNFWIIADNKLSTNPDQLRQAIFNSVLPFLHPTEPISLSILASHIVEHWDTEIWYWVFGDKLKIFLQQYNRLKIEGDKIYLVEQPAEKEPTVHPESDKVLNVILSFLRQGLVVTINVLDGHLKDETQKYCYEILNQQLIEFLSKYKAFIIENNKVRLIDNSTLVKSIEDYVSSKTKTGAIGVPIGHVDNFVKQHWKLSVESIAGCDIKQLICKVPSLQLDKDFVSIVHTQNPNQWSANDVS